MLSGKAFEQQLLQQQKKKLHKKDVEWSSVISDILK